MLRFAVRQIGDRVPVTTGLIPAHTAAAAASARSAGELGAAALQVFTPPVFMGEPLAWEPVAAYYEAIAAATDVPRDRLLGARRAGSDLSRSRCSSGWSRFPACEAIKESSWSRARFADAAAAFAGDRHDVALLSGQDTFILDSLRGGADGAMLAVAASDAAAFATMWTRRGTSEAADIQAALDPYIELLFAPPLRDFRARLKAVLAHDGVISTATVRSPLAGIGADEAAILNQTLATARAQLSG